MPEEEAIFINGGTIEKVFTSGTYKLSTNNYPFISRLKNAFSGGVSTFNCVVYFVRKSVTAELKWGTGLDIDKDQQNSKKTFTNLSAWICWYLTKMRYQEIRAFFIA